MKIEKAFDIELNETMLSFQPVGMAKEYHLYKDGVYYKTIPQAKNLFTFSENLPSYSTVPLTGGTGFGIDNIYETIVNSNTRYSVGIFFKEFDTQVFDAYNFALRRYTNLNVYDYYIQVPNTLNGVFYVGGQIRKSNQTSVGVFNYLLRSGSSQKYYYEGNLIYNGFSVYYQPAYNKELLKNAQPYQLFFGERITFELKERGTYTIKTIPLEDSNREESDFTEGVYYSGGMRVVFYKNSAENERVDKNDYLEEFATYTIKLKESCSITQPSLILKISTYPNFNYCYIPMFNRYYYVDNVTSINTDLWQIDLSVDVLMSYKEEILNTNAFVLRSESNRNDFIPDKMIMGDLHSTRYEYNYSPFKSVSTLSKSVWYEIFVGHTKTLENAVSNGLAKVHQWNFVNVKYMFFTLSASTDNYNDITFYDDISNNNISQGWFFPNRGTYQTFLYHIIYDSTPAGTAWGEWFSEPSEYTVASFATPLDLDNAYNDLYDENFSLQEIDVTPVDRVTMGRSISVNSPSTFKVGALNHILMFSEIGQIPEFNSYLDSDDYCTYLLYLPFIGIVEVSSERIERGKLRYVIYDVDIRSGDFVVYIDDKVYYPKEFYNTGVDKWKGNLYYEMPLGLSDARANVTNKFLSWLSAIPATVANIVRFEGGDVSAMVEQAGIAINFYGNLLTNPFTYSTTDSSGSAMNFRNYPHPILYKMTKNYYKPSNYGHLFGYPINQTFTLNELHGFTVVGEAHLDGFIALDEEKDSISKSLLEGVILP